jgi:hypothetical protein
VFDSNNVLMPWDKRKGLCRAKWIVESLLLRRMDIVIDPQLVRTCATTGQITKKHDLLRVARDIYCTTRCMGHTTSTRLDWF